MDCPECGYVLEAFDTECPCCKRLGAQARKAVPPAQKAVPPGQPGAPMTIPAPVGYLNQPAPMAPQVRAPYPATGRKPHGVFLITVLIISILISGFIVVALLPACTPRGLAYIYDTQPLFTLDMLAFLLIQLGKIGSGLAVLFDTDWGYPGYVFSALVSAALFFCGGVYLLIRDMSERWVKTPQSMLFFGSCVLVLLVVLFELLPAYLVHHTAQQLDDIGSPQSRERLQALEQPLSRTPHSGGVMAALIVSFLFSGVVLCVTWSALFLNSPLNALYNDAGGVGIFFLGLGMVASLGKISGGIGFLLFKCWGYYTFVISALLSMVITLVLDANGSSGARGSTVFNGYNPLFFSSLLITSACDLIPAYLVDRAAKQR